MVMENHEKVIFGCKWKVKKVKLYIWPVRTSFGDHIILFNLFSLSYVALKIMEKLFTMSHIIFHPLLF